MAHILFHRILNFVHSPLNYLPVQTLFPMVFNKCARFFSLNPESEVIRGKKMWTDEKLNTSNTAVGYRIEYELVYG